MKIMIGGQTDVGYLRIRLLQGIMMGESKKQIKERQESKSWIKEIKKIQLRQFKISKFQLKIARTSFLNQETKGKRVKLKE